MHTPQDPPARPSEESGSAPEGAGASRRNGTHASGGTGAAVGVELKSLFAELTSGPMPDHLLALMDQLESTLDEEPATAPRSPRNGRG
jgi:anti-sigma factor ChrR (cupin superfamily)